MENTINITNWKTGEVIFSYTCEDNTIKKTVEEAVKQGISLAYANLSNADLFDTDLSYADLGYADLSHAYLFKAKLYDTNLSYADLSHVYLDELDLLDDSFLKDIKGLNDQCPKEGSFIGWKKCFTKFGSYIVKLEIPADAKRSSATTNKCRCNKAKVLEIQNIDGTESDINEAYSWFDSTFKYEVGEMVKEPNFDERYWYECAPGIHFFMNREDAVSYL